MIKQIEVTVHGTVQGVSFRYYTRQKATQLKLTGWVANQDDGTVCVIAQGEEALLHQLVEFLHHGPAFAHVSDVAIKWQPLSKQYSRFKIRFI